MKSDDCVITLTIPKKLVLRYITERPDRPGGRSYAAREVDYIVRKALREQYIKMCTDEKEEPNAN